MRHEINLFDSQLRKPKVLLPARHVLFAWVAATLGLLFIYGWAVLSVNRAGAVAKGLHSEALSLKDQVQKLGETQSARKPSAEVQALVARREGLRRDRETVLARLRDADFGSTEGHARFLKALARQAPEGVWLTGVTVGGAGQDIRLEGRTLEPPLVARYLSNLGAETPLKGLAFNILEFRRPVDGEATPAPAKDAAVSRFLEFSVASRAETSAGKEKKTP